MFRWFKPRRVYIVWETSPDPCASAAMEHIFYSERECIKHVEYAQAAWANVDSDVQVYYTSQIVL